MTRQSRRRVEELALNLEREVVRLGLGFSRSVSHKTGSRYYTVRGSVIRVAGHAQVKGLVYDLTLGEYEGSDLQTSKDAAAWLAIRFNKTSSHVSKGRLESIFEMIRAGSIPDARKATHAAPGDPLAK